MTDVGHKFTPASSIYHRGNPPDSSNINGAGEKQSNSKKTADPAAEGVGGPARGRFLLLLQIIGLGPPGGGNSSMALLNTTSLSQFGNIGTSTTMRTTGATMSNTDSNQNTTEIAHDTSQTKSGTSTATTRSSYVQSTNRNNRQHSKQSVLSTSLDVLIVGSQNNVEAARTQFQTWGSHPAIRNFVLATEHDDPDPQCHESMKSWSHVEKYVSTCRNHLFWKNLDAHSLLTKYWVKRAYAHIDWLKKKKDPGGWLCAQKRFVAAFTKLSRWYADHASDHSQQEELRRRSVTDDDHDGVMDGFPDYLIIADDDTYMNIEHISEYLINAPHKLKNEKGLSNDEMYVPTPDVPVIFAGCRTRAPVGDIKWTAPFGGFGIFLSKAALEKWTHPISCYQDHKVVVSDDRSEFDQAICNKYLQQKEGGHQGEDRDHGNSVKYNESVYPFNATVGEDHFFKSGDSLNEVFYKYIHGMEYFCLHSDWFFGYIANFLNISRHVITTQGELPVVGQGETARWFDQFDEEKQSPLNRLHAMMGSEFYSHPEGLCLYGNGLQNNKVQTIAIHEKIESSTSSARNEGSIAVVEGNATKKKKYNRFMMVNQMCQPNTTICHYMNMSELERIFYAEESNIQY